MISAAREATVGRVLAELRAEPQTPRQDVVDGQRELVADRPRDLRLEERPTRYERAKQVQLLRRARRPTEPRYRAGRRGAPRASGWACAIASIVPISCAI